MNNKICYITPSYLGDYNGCASDRPKKFVRCVNTFLTQKYRNIHLVIISDGCEKTIDIYNHLYKFNPNIHLVKIPKQPLFSGNVRQSGIDYAHKKIKPDVFAPLDSDDFILPDHAEKINKFMGNNDFIYSDEFYYIRPSELKARGVNIDGAVDNNPLLAIHPVGGLIKNIAGTSSVVWRNKIQFTWKAMDGWGHDFMFIQNMVKHSKKYQKVDIMGYVITHVDKWFDN